MPSASALPISPDLERIRSAGLALQSLLNRGARATSRRTDDHRRYRAKLRHDLRTPINAVKGYGEMMLEDARDGGHDALLSDLEKLLTAADGMLARIDALVEFSRPATAPTVRRHTDRRRRLACARCACGPSRRASPRSGNRYPGRILVVDDNASNRDLLSRQLARDGHAVEAAVTAREGWRWLDASEDFDLILLDLLMPDISGYEVLSG